MLEAAGLLRRIVGEKPFIASDDDGRLSIEMRVSPIAKLYVFVSADDSTEAFAYTEAGGTERLRVRQLSELATAVAKLAAQV